jgi:cysteinyl-tRNA synthetase
MDGVHVARPTDTPHATDWVDPMVALIAELVAKDKAYVTDDGVYLSVETVPDYGLLAQQSLDQLRAGGGDRTVVGAEHKRDPADFALWKLAKPGEPAWPSPWGGGRPGWHTECVVMSLELLGEGFDLHCGGLDLKFPHHENERAQAVALGRRFANHWMHHAFVVDEGGEKMSKSVGNIENLLDLIDKVDGRAFRLALLQAHYRSPVQVGPDRLEAATRALGRIDSLARRAADLPEAEPDPSTLAAFSSRMDDDLDTPGAMAVVFDTVSRANRQLDAGDDGAGAPLVAAVWSMCSAVGLTPRAEGDIPADIQRQADALDAARAEKDFAMADTLRAALQSEGWVVETTKAGTKVRRA